MYSFTGSAKRRPMINLGGQSNLNNPSEIMRRAKEERQLREKFKHQQAAVSIIQTFWRSRTDAGRTKTALRNRFDQLVSFIFDNSDRPANSSLLKLSPQDHLELSRLILVFYTPNQTDDQRRLVAWANQSILNPEPAFLTYVQRDDELGHSWRRITPLMIKRILQTVADFPRSEHTPIFLAALKEMVNDLNRRSDLQALIIMGSTWYWKLLRKYITAFEVTDKSVSKSVARVIELSVSFFHVLPPDQKINLASIFAAQIFTIPLLPNRLGIQPLIQFSASLPFVEILAGTERFAKELELKEIIHLLSNLLVWGSKKVVQMDQTGFRGYLNSIQLCLDRIPIALFRKVDTYLANKTSVKAKRLPQSRTPKIAHPSASNSNEIIRESSGAKNNPILIEEEDIEMNEPSDSNLTTAVLNSISPKTLQWLSILVQSEHLSQLCSMSARYSSTCQPHLCRLMVSIIYLWPTSKETVLNTLIYMTPSVGPSSRSANQSGGFIKELWRMSVRPGKISVSLRDRKSGGSPQGVLTTLKDSKLAGQWEDLILLCELYSRYLMTLGDEEFFDDEAEVASTLSFQRAKTSVISTSRNPLMTDEVVTLAGLLRNLAFGLYWTEGQADIKKGCVVGTHVSLEYLRSLATRLLQQIYIRDSRRPFCEPGFWSMTSTFDLQSFMQTVVYEESHLEEIREDQLQSPAHLLNQDPDLDISNHLSSSRGSRARVSQRQLAFISPRLGVLNNIPFVIPFEQRVAIFRTFINSDRHRLGLDLHSFGENRHKASIRRQFVSEDGFTHLNALGPRLKETIEIKFIDPYGLEEAGIDGGGVFKEFLTSLTKEVFDVNKGLWLVNKNQEIYPNPHSYSRQPLSLEWYKFLGRVLGKALYEGILIDIDFADFFLNKWLGKQSYLDDLASLDPELYQGLIFLKHYKGDVEADLSLNFTVTNNEFDASETIELIPEGSKTSVTAQNRINYIYLMSNYKLNIQLESQCAAFFKGLNDIIELKWLRMFNQLELKVLVGGLDGQDLDIDDMQQWTVYGGWDESHPTIRIFWKVLREFDNLTKRKLLRFVTSCARPPLLGFKELRPSFAIRSSGVDRSRLPSASTCVNLLKLPEYQTEAELREKVLYAINAGAGFDLS
ncbi:hypothetical protein PGT21_012536 [Puccinia graminis f. sp. tritici]|uniref:HECT-type E3 ubiquitin transferase n=1 Tax=Puccinia graminis f. sp. tritici TaxID=56615 RepID=A0A5B0P4D4_PUCGR|nr:hypothetical protein PGT21_012536 [Puccinia graminis f. sp. tritici]KAA1132117.1 hypothetical protein PGTUg99_037227 [Puccinia graminis f. sp. tritici]